MSSGEGEPGRDPGLQPERTSLAWRRLALALLGLALAVPKLGWQALGPWALVPAAIVAAGALTLVAASHRRYLHTHEVLSSRSAPVLPDGRLPMVTVLAALILAAVGALIVTVR
jgi:uncharacterized membrane protein YidH (DUF202 family)